MFRAPAAAVPETSVGLEEPRLEAAGLQPHSPHLWAHWPRRGSEAGGDGGFRIRIQASRLFSWRCIYWNMAKGGKRLMTLIEILKRKNVSSNPTTTVFIFFYIISHLHPHAHTQHLWILYLRTRLSQKCIGNPKTRTRSTFLVVDRHAQSAEKFKSPQLVFPAEVEHVDTLPSRSGSHAANKCPCHSLPRSSHFCASRR